jgi:peptide/nickel transport system substrate-binding protein
MLTRAAWPVLFLLSFSLVLGCGKSKSGASSGDGKAADGGQDDAGADGAADGSASTPNGDVPFKLGDLIEKFDPPPLVELEKSVEWEDMPVLDSLKLLRERQADEQPLITVAEALKLRNTSDKANAEILSALGRAAPVGGANVDWDAEITRHTAADVKSTNPIMASSTVEFDVSGLVGFGLFSFDWNFNPFASSDTVTSWQSSKDRMYDKVVLRDDLTWSDGTPITAHDIEFSFEVIMTEAVPVPAMRSGTEDLKYIKAYDDRTLVYFHKKPLATNIWNLNFSIIPKHIYADTIAEDPTLQDSPAHVALEKNPVTGGAYTIADRTLGSEIVLARRESWYMHDGKQVRDKPYFQRVRFRVILEPSVALLQLKAGDIEEKELTPEEWKTKTTGDDYYKNNTKARGTEWTYFYFGWNVKSPFFTDKRVRQAMGYAFDHKEMLETLQFGLVEPSNGIFHPESRWHPKDAAPAYTQDLDKAEDLLDAAGWEDSDGDGIRDKEINGRSVPFEFSIVVMNRPDRVAICNLLKDNLEQIGVTCNVRPLEFTVLQQKSRDHEFQAMMAGWGTGATPDISENLWKSNQNRNYGQYENKKIDALFDQAKEELDESKREAIFGQIHNILYDEQPYTWLYFRNSFYGFNKKLRGYNFSPRGPYNYGPGFSSIYQPME